MSSISKKERTMREQVPVARDGKRRLFHVKEIKKDRKNKRKKERKKYQIQERTREGGSACAEGRQKSSWARSFHFRDKGKTQRKKKRKKEPKKKVPVASCVVL